MKNRTLKELLSLAKARGLKGYSKLGKDELIRRLQAGNSKTASAAAKKPAAKKTAPSAANTARTKEKPKKSKMPGATPARSPAATTGATTSVPQPSRAPAPAPRPAPAHAAISTEELVESAKYALEPSGRSARPATTDLDEDIDRLPELTEPLVCLLPQKPGVLHAYWALPPNDASARNDYKLRLVSASNEALELHAEIPVRGERGSWYFHVQETSNAAMVVQLGHYENGRFVAARGRSIARLPRLPSPHASTRTDERWWIDEADFLRMYVRAGGVVTPTRRYSWTASIGSPVGASQSSETQIAWPGGVSSSSK